MFNKKILEEDLPVLVTTEEQDFTLRKWAHEQGKTWKSKSSYLELTMFKGEPIFMNLGTGTWGEGDYPPDRVISYDEALIKVWPKEMIVSDYEDFRASFKRYVHGILSHNGYYVTRYGETYEFAKPVPQKRFMTCGEVIDWWCSQIRLGHTPARRDKRARVIFRPGVAARGSQYCPDYTGGSSDEWIHLMVQD